MLADGQHQKLGRRFSGIEDTTFAKKRHNSKLTAVKKSYFVAQPLFLALLDIALNFISQNFFNILNDRKNFGNWLHRNRLSLLLV